MNTQTIGYPERSDDNPSLMVALALADHFDVRVEWLFTLTPFDGSNDRDPVDVR